MLKKFRDGPLGSIIILLCICLIVMVAVFCTHTVTQSVISGREIAAANKTRQQLLHTASDFDKLDEITFPQGVTEAYRAADGEGYVFTSESKGYAGMVTYLVAISKDSKIAGIQMFSHAETPGVGTKIGEEAYLSKYYGLSNPDPVDSVSGATITSNSLKTALKQALDAYDRVKEVGQA